MFDVKEEYKYMGIHYIEPIDYNMAAKSVGKATSFALGL